VQERIGTIILSAIVAHTAWHWMTARGSELRQYEFTRPVLDAAFAAAALRAAMLLLAAGLALWGVNALATRWQSPRRDSAAIDQA
jgi:hypothetical protein